MITRREYAKGVFSAVLSAGLGAAAALRHSLSNVNLELEIAIENGKIATRRFHNRLTREAIDLPAEQFAFEFQGGAAVDSAALEVKAVDTTPAYTELLFVEPRGPLQVRVRYELQPGKAYLRKRIWTRLVSGEGRRLLRADLENWRGVRRAWSASRSDHLPYGSHPIHCDTLWAGVEFVAAFNEYGADGFVLRSRPGGKSIGSQWSALRSTVLGVAEPKGVRGAFLRYIEDVRLAPPRLVACYNSWWSLPLRIKQREHMDLVRELKHALFDRHGVFFDLVATDEGWTDPHTIWQIDRSNLPRGFDDIREIVESAGARLGLWISPSENYPRTLDYKWAEENGYVVVWPERNAAWDGRRGVSLADPKYRNEATATLRRIIQENRLAHIKYDGFIAAENVPHNGLLPGIDSIEPLAEGLLELLAATRTARPDLVAEPTCLNELVNYSSPWIIQSADSTWAGAGGDCPQGVGPAPVYRESHTNSREFSLFSALDGMWLPQNALQAFDIVHCDDAAGFANHAAMAFGRGRFFVPAYVNPKLMADEDWRIFAGLLRWARANREILQNTLVLPSRVELGEPYVYAHWLGSRGILAVRNPSNESKEFRIDLQKSGAPRELSEAVCYTQYPYRKGIATGLHNASTVALRLSPWELVFLEIVPLGQLREPVAVNARWFRGSGGEMTIVPDANVESVRVLQTSERRRIVPVKPMPRAAFGGKLVAGAIRRLPAGEGLAQETIVSWRAEQGQHSSKAVPGGQILPGSAFEIECAVSVPPGPAKGKLLLLVEFPGVQHRPSRCTAMLNGKVNPVAVSHSAGHIADTAKNAGVRPYLSQWTWYTCDVPAGTSNVRFTGAAGDVNPRIGLWAWLESDLGGAHVPAEMQASEAAMPQYLPNLQREGICLKNPARPF